MEDYQPEYLYHYTTVETLALILNSKKMRFNSLINVDDLEESKTKNLKECGKYCYVSCFTSDEKESIPVWNMYSNKGSGVRLKLAANPFEPNSFENEEATNNNEKILGRACMVVEKIDDNLRFSSISNKISLVEVSYTEDKDKLMPTVMLDDTIMLDYNLIKYLGIYKRTCWQFQNEWRYIKYITPGNIQGIECNKDVYSSYIDIKLKDDALKNLEVTLGYNVSAGNRLIVYKIVDSYNNENENCHIVIKDSELKDKIR